MNNKVEIRDTVERVTGRLRYVDDIKRSDFLQGIFVRSESSNAEIISISTEDAEKSAGVVRVYSYLDFPDGVPKYGPFIADQPILAEGVVKYFGEPVVFVVAVTREAAISAAKLIKIVYKHHDPIIDIRNPECSKSHLYFDEPVHTVLENSWGDCEEAAEKADLIIENDYYMPHIHHAAMETYSCIAEPNAGGIEVSAAIQSPFQSRRIIAAMLNLPASRVQIKGMEMGGGFGGRGYPKIEPAAAWFAHDLQQPLKIKLTAEEGFLVAQRESAFIKMRNGFSKNGRMLFHDIKADFGTGAYLDISPRVINKSGMLGSGAYKIDNVNIRFRGIKTNTTPTTAFRGFGAAHVCFALESQLDEAARKLGLDSVEIRMKNLPNKGEQIIPAEKPVDGDWKGCFMKAADKIGFYDEAPDNRARSIAIGIKNSIAATTAFTRVRINTDGSAMVYIGTSEMGQGSKAVAAKYINRFLGIDIDQVHVVAAKTESVPFDFITASSRSTVSMGLSIENACSKLQAELFEIVEQNYSETPRKIEAGAVLTDSGTRISFYEILAKRFGAFLGELEASGEFVAEKDSRNQLGGPCLFYEFVVTAVETSVDHETGELKIHRMVNVSDAGRLINPIRAAGVDEGGAVMGIGGAAMEQLIYSDDGILRNGSTLDYRLPTIMDIPEEMDSYFIENRDGPGPGGEKGIGEGAILAVAPAIKEGTFKCTGLDIREQPYTSELIWRHLKGIRKKK